MFRFIRSVKSGFSLLCFVLAWTICQCTEIDLTVEVPPGKQECFFHTIRTGIAVELDYQVIDGGDLDITVILSAPDNTVIHADSKKVDNVIRFKSKHTGDYKLCFDNTFSRISSKVVYFELFVDDPLEEEDDDEDDEDGTKLTFDGENIQDMLDMTVDDFSSILDRAKENLIRSRQVQTLIRIHEAKDRNIQEANYNRVNFLSGFQLALMIAVGVLQVFMIRNLFQQKKPVSGGSLKQRT